MAWFCWMILTCQGFTFCDHRLRNTDVRRRWFCLWKHFLVLWMVVAKDFSFWCLGEWWCRVLLVDQDGLILKKNNFLQCYLVKNKKIRLRLIWKKTSMKIQRDAHIVVSWVQMCDTGNWGGQCVFQFLQWKHMIRIKYGKTIWWICWIEACGYYICPNDDLGDLTWLENCSSTRVGQLSSLRQMYIGS